MRRQAPRAAIHQMCQIRAKPVTTAKKALTKPVGLFFGTSIGSYCARLRWLTLRFARVCLLDPIGVSAGDTGQDCKVPGRRRRRRGPFERAAVPGISGHVAELLRGARIDTTNCMIWQTTPAKMMTAPAAATNQPRLPVRQRRNAAGAASCPSGRPHRAA